MNGISNKNNGLSSFLQVLFKTVIENVFTDIGIEGTEAVIN